MESSGQNREEGPSSRGLPRAAVPGETRAGGEAFGEAPKGPVVRAWPVLLGFPTRWDGIKRRQGVLCSLFPEMRTGVSNMQLIKVRSDSVKVKYVQ